MKIAFEAEAEQQLYDLADMIDDLNIRGAGDRWINRFLDFIEDYALPNGSLPSLSSFTIKAGRFFCISAPLVGSRPINQISLCFIKMLQV